MNQNKNRLRLFAEVLEGNPFPAKLVHSPFSTYNENNGIHNAAFYRLFDLKPPNKDLLYLILLACVFVSSFHLNFILQPILQSSRCKMDLYPL